MANTVLEKMAELITKEAATYAKAYNGGKTKKSDLKVLRDKANKAVADYNLQLSKETYRQWAKEGDPVRTAIRSFYIPGAKAIQFKTDDDNYMTVHIKACDYQVNLPQMQATLGAGVFHDPKWFNKCEKLAWIIANNINDRMGDGANFEYHLSQASKAFKFPDGVDPLSDEGVLVALQEVFDAILFLPDDSGKNIISLSVRKTEHGETTAKEWEFIHRCMTKHGAMYEVKVCNTGTFTSLVMEAMNGILTHAAFKCSADGSFDMPDPDKDEAKPVKKPAKKAAKKADVAPAK